MRHHTAALASGPLAVFLLLSGCVQHPPLMDAPLAAPTNGASPAPVTASSSSGPAVPTPAPTATTAASPAPTPTPSPLRLVMDFESDAVGTVPADFVDVSTEETVPSWVYAGNWKVAADETGNHVFLHDDIREQPAVSFMRYRGTALGKPNGELPDAYYAEVAMRPIKSPNNYPPTGDQGVQFYFLKFDQYLEVVVKPDQFEIWECNGGKPKTTEGWHRLWYTALSTNAGDTRLVGALVDKRAGNFTAYLDGKPQGTVQSTLLAAQPSWLALRGIGNVVSFDNLKIEPR